MPKYNVHLYAVVRMRFDDIEADSQVDAISIAEGLDLHKEVENLGRPTSEATNYEYADENVYFLVDEVDDDQYLRSESYKFSLDKKYLVTDRVSGNKYIETRQSDGLWKYERAEEVDGN